jgi:RNA polymerase sigma factor (sigma-70 family)
MANIDTDPTVVDVIDSTALEQRTLTPEEMYKEHYSELFNKARYLYRFTPDDAEDIVGHVFQKAFDTIAQARQKDKDIVLKTGWYHTVLGTTAIDVIRKNKRRKTVPSDTDKYEWMADPDSDSDYDKVSKDQIMDRVMGRAANILSEDKFNVFNEFITNGLSYKELAEKFDIPVGTAQSRLFRAFRDLRLVLADDPDLHELLGRTSSDSFEDFTHHN